MPDRFVLRPRRGAKQLPQSSPPELTDGSQVTKVYDTTGAAVDPATSANQDTANTHLAAIKTAAEKLDDTISGTVSRVAPSASTDAVGASTAFDPTVSNTVENIKASAGHLLGLHVHNPDAAEAFLQLFDVAGSPTVGTTTPKLSLRIEAGGDLLFMPALPIAFATAIRYAATTTVNGGTAPGSDLVLNAIYI